jgi:hypothetical protein
MLVGYYHPQVNVAQIVGVASAKRADEPRRDHAPIICKDLYHALQQGIALLAPNLK